MAEKSLELNEYIRQGEPDRVDKSNAWKTAIGLQDVDGLKTSKYLIETAKEHIEGKISISEVDKRVHSYYEERKDRSEIEEDTKEADIVSVRIAKILGEKTHVDYEEQSAIQSANINNSKCNNCTLEELAIIQALINNPTITQKQLASVICKSERTVKSRTVEMQEKGLIARKNGKRNGKWIVLVEI